MNSFDLAAGDGDKYLNLRDIDAGNGESGKISGYMFDTVLWRVSRVEFYDRITRQRLSVFSSPSVYFSPDFLTCRVNHGNMSRYNRGIDKSVSSSAMFEINFLRRKDGRVHKNPSICSQMLYQTNRQFIKYREFARSLSIIIIIKTFFPTLY